MMCAGWMRFRASLVAMEKDCIDAGAAAGAVDSPGNRRPATWHRHVSLVMLAFAEPLDLDTAEASIALDPEQLAGDLGKPPLLDGQPWPPGGARVPEKGVPVLLRQRRIRRGIVDSGGPRRL
jgi:hypothetical protein